MSGLKAVDDTTLHRQAGGPVLRSSRRCSVTPRSTRCPRPPSATTARSPRLRRAAHRPGPVQARQALQEGHRPDGRHDGVRQVPRHEAEGRTKLQFKLYNSPETAYNDLRPTTWTSTTRCPPRRSASAKTDLGDRYMTSRTPASATSASPSVQRRPTRTSRSARPSPWPSTARPSPRRSSPAPVHPPTTSSTRPSRLPSGRLRGLHLRPGARPRSSTPRPGPGEAGDRLQRRRWPQGVDRGRRQQPARQPRCRGDGQAVREVRQHPRRPGRQEVQGHVPHGLGIDYPSAENYLSPIFSTGAIKTGSNYAGYSNKEFDDLVAKGDQAATAEEGLKFYQQADDVLIKDLRTFRCTSTGKLRLLEQGQERQDQPAQPG